MGDLVFPARLPLQIGQRAPDEMFEGGRARGGVGEVDALAGFGVAGGPGVVEGEALGEGGPEVGDGEDGVGTLVVLVTQVVGKGVGSGKSEWNAKGMGFGKGVPQMLISSSFRRACRLGRSPRHARRVLLPSHLMYCVSHRGPCMCHLSVPQQRLIRPGGL